MKLFIFILVLIGFVFLGDRFFSHSSTQQLPETQPVRHYITPKPPTLPPARIHKDKTPKPATLPPKRNG